jgi:hypothetical protein
MNTLTKLKRHVVEHLLIECPQILVACAVHHPDTRVPAQFKDADAVTLLWGMQLPVPIKDLRTDDHGLSGTLSFGRTPHFCVVPWESIICVALEDGTEPVVGFPVQRYAQPGPTESDKLKLLRQSRRRKAPPKLQLLRGGASAVPSVNVGGCPGGVDTVEPA